MCVNVCWWVGIYICIHGASKEVERGISEVNGGRKTKYYNVYDIQNQDFYMSICEIHDIYLYT